MASEEIGNRIEGMRVFLDKFILFHLGRDARVQLNPAPGEKVICSISHIRIEDIRFELDSAELSRFEKDIPAFEDYLLDFLTKHRRGLAIDD